MRRARTRERGSATAEPLQANGCAGGALAFLRDALQPLERLGQRAGDDHETALLAHAVGDEAHRTQLERRIFATIGTRLSLIHISEPTRQAEISYAVFCLKKKKKKNTKKKNKQTEPTSRNSARKS